MEVRGRIELPNKGFADHRPTCAVCHTFDKIAVPDVAFCHIFATSVSGGGRLMRPLCIDLYCGLGGWAEGFLAEGWDVIGFDNHRHEYGEAKYPGQLVIQDVLTLHGSQFRDAAVIVASPPCKNYSYLAMPWSRSSDPNNSKAAKALRLKWETEGPDNRLFDACFRIQREAIEATGKSCRDCNGTGMSWTCCRCHYCDGKGYVKRYIPLVVENVRGAQPWVGRSAWNYGSFHLWGDVPALMPIRSTFKNTGGSWFAVAHNTESGLSHNPVNEPGKFSKSDRESGGWFNDYKSDGDSHCVGISRTGSRSKACKAASAQIAKIPFPLSNHIARVYTPRSKAVA